MSNDQALTTPLPAAWTLWFYHRDKNIKFNNYLAGTHEVLGFDTPATFWQLYTHLTPVKSLHLWSEYQIFRKGVKPMWEDPHNAEGGRWSLRLKLRKHTSNDGLWHQRHLLYVQDYAPYVWERLLLEIVSGSFSQNRLFDDQEVLGLVISVRREEYVIAIWNRNSTDAAIISSLQEAILDVCSTTPDVTLEYSPHSESLTKVSEKSKARPRQQPRRDYKKVWRE